MIINKTNIDKITKSFELVCPMFKEDLITEAFIVGSVSKGIARADSDIDVYLINSDFKKQKDKYNIQLVPELLLKDESEENIYTNKIIELLKALGAEFKYLETKQKSEYVWYQFYKGEKFHFMYDYESESIKKGGEYIEITRELCNEVNE